MKKSKMEMERKKRRTINTKKSKEKAEREDGGQKKEAINVKTKMKKTDKRGTGKDGKRKKNLIRGRGVGVRGGEIRRNIRWRRRRKM